VKAHAAHAGAALALEQREIVDVDAIAAPQDAPPGSRSRGDARCAHTDVYRWKFHHQDAGQPTRYTSNPRGT
jgi:hypothetical protein